VPIARGQVTKVRVEIPPDIETRIRELVDSTPDPDKFEAALAPLRHQYSRATLSPPLESPFLTLAKVSVAGTQPLPQSDLEPVAGDSAQ
jgi:3-methyladenine DNA glycosylase/8-oxoguanine DNA glycosylase